MKQVLDCGPFALVSSSGNVSNAEMDRERFAEKDRAFTAQKASGTFPAVTCKECRGEDLKREVYGCCQRDWHHVGDCCLHCGNDERGPNAGPL